MFQYKSSSYRRSIDFLLTSLPDPLEKEARFHRLRTFPFFSLQFELVLALWCYTVANVDGKRSKPLKLRACLHGERVPRLTGLPGFSYVSFENPSKRLHARQGNLATPGTLSTCPRHPARRGSLLLCKRFEPGYLG